MSLNKLLVSAVLTATMYGCGGAVKTSIEPQLRTTAVYLASSDVHQEFSTNIDENAKIYNLPDSSFDKVERIFESHLLANKTRVLNSSLQVTLDSLFRDVNTKIDLREENLIPDVHTVFKGMLKPWIGSIGTEIMNDYSSFFYAKQAGNAIDLVIIQAHGSRSEDSLIVNSLKRGKKYLVGKNEATDYVLNIPKHTLSENPVFIILNCYGTNQFDTKRIASKFNAKVFSSSRRTWGKPDSYGALRNIGTFTVTEP